MFSGDYFTKTDQFSAGNDFDLVSDAYFDGSDVLCRVPDYVTYAMNRNDSNAVWNTTRILTLASRTGAFTSEPLQLQVIPRTLLTTVDVDENIITVYGDWSSYCSSTTLPTCSVFFTPTDGSDPAEVVKEPVFIGESVIECSIPVYGDHASIR